MTSQQVPNELANIKLQVKLKEGYLGKDHTLKSLEVAKKIFTTYNKKTESFDYNKGQLNKFLKATINSHKYLYPFFTEEESRSEESYMKYVESLADLISLGLDIYLNDSDVIFDLILPKRILIVKETVTDLILLDEPRYDYPLEDYLIFDTKVFFNQFKNFLLKVFGEYVDIYIKSKELKDLRTFADKTTTVNSLILMPLEDIEKEIYHIESDKQLSNVPEIMDNMYATYSKLNSIYDKPAKYKSVLANIQKKTSHFPTELDDLSEPFYAVEFKFEA